VKKIKILLLITILLAGILFPVKTLANSGATVTIGNVTLDTGASGSVALSISGAAEPISCINVNVSYNSAVVEVTSVSGSDFNSLVDNIQNDLGCTRLVGYVTSETGLTGTIKVADITLKRIDGESVLTLEVTTLKDDEGESIPFTVVNGKISAPAPTPTPPPSGGGEGSPTFYLSTNLFGMEKSLRIDSDGKILETLKATSPDNMLNITVPKNTVALDGDGKRLNNLQVVTDNNPPEPPKGAHIIGLAYDFGPHGATFDPPMTLTWSYNPDALPEGMVEEDLVVAYYDDESSKWVELKCKVDVVNNVITASVSHFTTFAIIGVIPPPSPPAPATFSSSNLRIEPAEVQPGEAVTITVTVTNSGGTEGSYTVVLNINGQKETEKSITVAAGESQNVTFSVTRKEVGNYSVVVEGLSGSFAVETLPPPTQESLNRFLIVGIVAAVIIIILLIFLLVKRRRAY
jgi:hypothetical protein